MEMRGDNSRCSWKTADTISVPLPHKIMVFTEPLRIRESPAFIEEGSVFRKILVLTEIYNLQKKF